MMPSKTTVSAKTLEYSLPSIFRSYEPGSFSESLSQILVTKEVEIPTYSLANRGAAAGSFILYDRFPEPGSNVQYAVYDFCVNVSAIPQVKAVTYQIENNIVIIWTFISKRDKEVRRLIYEKEMKLMSSYSNTVFDFNVVTISDYSDTFIPQDLQGTLSYYVNY